MDTTELSAERWTEIRSLDLLVLMDDTSAPIVSRALADLIAEVERLRAQLGSVRAELASLKDETDRLTADNARLLAELAAARAATDSHVTRALDYLAGLDTTRMSMDAIGLGFDIVAILDGPGDPDPAPAVCTCGAAPVHQHGCPAGQ